MKSPRQIVLGVITLLAVSVLGVLTLITLEGLYARDDAADVPARDTAADALKRASELVQQAEAQLPDESGYYLARFELLDAEFLSDLDEEQLAEIVRIRAGLHAAFGHTHAALGDLDRIGDAASSRTQIFARLLRCQVLARRGEMEALADHLKQDVPSDHPAAAGFAQLTDRLPAMQQSWELTRQARERLKRGDQSEAEALVEAAVRLWDENPTARALQSGFTADESAFQELQVKAKLSDRDNVFVAFANHVTFEQRGQILTMVRGLVRTFTGHTRQVASVAFSPDGRRVLTGSVDKTAKLWDADTGREIRTFTGHADVVRSVAFAPDGRRVLTGSWDETAKLWDAETGRLLKTFAGHTGQLYSLAISSDGRRVLTGSWDNTAKLWDADTGRELRTFTGHTQSVTSVAFAPGGRRVLTGSSDKTAKLWDANTGRELRTFAGHTARVWSVAFSPDGRRVLTGSSDGTAKLWEAETGRELRTSAGHNERGSVRSVAFSPDGRRVLTGYDHTANLWDAETGRELRTFAGHTARVWSVAFSPDGRRVLTGSRDKTAMLWDVNVP